MDLVFAAFPTVIRRNRSKQCVTYNANTLVFFMAVERKRSVN
jgi:hypothetical protein